MSMIGQAQFSSEDLLGKLSRQFVEQLLMMAAESVAVPGYAALARDEDLSRRIADVLTCNVSTRKYTRVMYQRADEIGISRSAVSRHFIKDSAQALAKMMARDFTHADLVAVYVDGIIVARHPGTQSACSLLQVD